MSVAQVGEMSAAEFDFWMVRAATHPFLAQRIEVGLAQIAMLFYNTNCKKGHSKELKDFMLFAKKAESEKPVDAQVMDVFSKMLTPEAK